MYERPVKEICLKKYFSSIQVTMLENLRINLQY